MSKPVKTKLCWNCEGNVSRTAENCPYCAVYLSPESEDLKALQQSAPKAPYKPEKAKDIPKAPYSPVNEVVADQEEVLAKEGVVKHNAFQSLFLPLIFLTTGLIFLFFSLMLFLFSEHGKLTLQWDGDIWYIYGILAVPLLILGWYYLNQSSDNN